MSAQELYPVFPGFSEIQFKTYSELKRFTFQKNIILRVLGRLRRTDADEGPCGCVNLFEADEL